MSSQNPPDNTSRDDDAELEAPAIEPADSGSESTGADSVDEQTSPAEPAIDDLVSPEAVETDAANAETAAIDEEPPVVISSSEAADDQDATGVDESGSETASDPISEPEVETATEVETETPDVEASGDLGDNTPTETDVATDTVAGAKASRPKLRKPRSKAKPETAPTEGDEAYGAAETWPEPPVPASHASWPASSKPRAFDLRNVLPWLDWKYSIILPVALLLCLATVLWSVSNRSDTIELTVLNSSSGEPIPGANVIVGNKALVASEEGKVAFDRPDEPTTLEVKADGFIPVTGEVTKTTALEQQVMLRPSTLVGRVTDQDTGEPLAGISISIVNQAGETVASTSTDDSGTYRLTDVPEIASIQVDGGPYGTFSQDIGGALEMSFPLAIRSATGVVLDDDGEPVQGAIVQSGESTAVSTGDGTFTLEGVSDGDEITILAPGFVQATTSVSRGVVQDVQLERQMIKAVYANSGILTSPDGLQSLIDIANTTEINAIVIDVKEGIVFYDSDVAFFNDAGTVRPIFDLEEVLQILEENDIYAIARMVVFQDPIVASERPDLAVHDVNGGLWTNVDGVAWVSAYHEELWNANIDLAVELADRGFDEIQYDYVRFPSDGDLSTADFGREYTAESREQAITEFMKRSHEAINAAGAYLAADLFGFITIVDDEQYIGQRFSMLAPHLDFICMMIYPSHFETGNIASAPGHPNDYPYETIFESLERAEANVPGSTVKFRPWLQDFSYGFNGLRDYDASDVRAQIDAAEDFGASGWMLWGDPFDVTVDALKPDPEA
jgi:hypothetical protein